MASSSRFDSISAQNHSRQDWYRDPQLRYGLFFGVIGALAYSWTAWGVDGYKLAQSNAIYPWLKLGLGTWICVLLAGLGGLFTVMMDRGQVSIPTWAFIGVFFGWLAGRLPFDGTTMLLNRFDRDLFRLLDYTFYDGPLTRMVLAIASTTGILLFSGLFLPTLVDISSRASRFFERWMPVVLWVVVFIVAGSLVDSTINEPMRSPIIIIDDLIQYQLDQGKTLTASEAGQEMRVAALGSVLDLIHHPRSLIIGDYDDTMVTVNVLVNFDGVWVNCVVLAAQPGYCRPMR
jgi:hypothetical protein